MTLLHKLENTYLAILRFAVIVVAGLMLIATAILLMGSLPALRSNTPPAQATPNVTPDAMIEALSAPKEKASTPERPSKGKRPQLVDETIVNNISDAMQTFVKEKSGGRLNVHLDKLRDAIRDGATSQETPELTQAYLAGFATALNQTLRSPTVLARLVPSGANDPDVGSTNNDGSGRITALEVVVDFMVKYRERFAESIVLHRIAHQKAIEAQANNRTEAIGRLYLAGGVFGAFMLVVFLSIFVKIERNLRPLNETSTTFRN